jgi:hypothetical protein
MSQLKSGILHENLPLLEVANPQELDVLLADARTAQFIRRRLSPHIAVIAPGQDAALLARLRKLGHTPKVVER